ncbi:MAG: FAD-dependent oxidoreductase, partial [Chloroflexi bacterium]|nr:FAD-dependent oxidoreductase [Chloroflexota bacterium]
PVSNLFLAGDWTDTGWPATMESAVRSGLLAAREVLVAERAAAGKEVVRVT